MVTWTPEQLQEFKRRQAKGSASTSSTQEESSPSPQPSRPPSKSSSTCRPSQPLLPEESKWGKMNKTELEFLKILQSAPGAWSLVERESLKIQLGNPGARCSYTPDFVACHAGKGLTIIEVKGAYEYPDATIKRKTAARWCAERGIGFFYAQKTARGWEYSWLA